jgi:outer membrane immunogenic protein
MRRNTLGWFSIAVLASGFSQAQAADMPVYKKAPPPPVVTAYQWTGLYVGGFAAGTWGDKRWTEVVGPFPGVQIAQRVHGFLGGGEIGFNYQAGAWVFGVEADLGWTNADGSSNCVVGPPFICVAKVKSLATAAGRVGYAWDRTLLYVKGGGAWASDEYHATLAGVNLNTGLANPSGWTVGAGLEYGFAPNWSAKIEYDYMDLGTSRVRFNDGAVEDINQRMQAVKLGINYHFGVPGPVSARY